MPDLRDAVLAVDIGATSIKFAVVEPHGEIVGALQRRPTPYPCPPDRLVDVVAERARGSGCTRIGVGFPGEYRDGRAVGSGNLARVGGIGTPIDPALERAWQGFALEEALAAATGLEVRVVNDATLAALGCRRGVGREVVLTLGTGLGLALIVEGELRPVRDVGAEIRADGRTYDQTLGEQARAMSEEQWRTDLRAIVTSFTAEFDATEVHLAGGNARRVSPTWFEGLPVHVAIHGNDAALRGAARLF
ncbi:MAG: ROK family protein [Acidimicrobiales bacterium]